MAWKSLSEQVSARSSDVHQGSSARLDPRSRARIRVAGAVALLLAGLVPALTGADRLREAVFDRYQARMPRQVDRLFGKIVEIDEASLEQFGPWPWPRFLLARLTRAIFDGGALAVGFDMVFPEPDRHRVASFVEVFPEVSDELRAQLATLPDPDRAFAREIGRHPVVLGRAGLSAAAQAGLRGPEDLAVVAEFEGDQAPARLLSFQSAVANILELDAVAAGQGLLNGIPDDDGVIRKVPLVAEVAGRLTPSMPMELLRVAIGVDRIRLEARGESVTMVGLADLRVPTEPDGRLRLHFTPPYTERTVSAAAVLNASLGQMPFKGFVVLVGASAVGLEDVVATPVAAQGIGPDVHIQTIENLLTGSWLSRPTWAPWAEWLTAACLGALIILLFPRFSPALAVAALCVVLAAVLAGSVVAFGSARLLLGPVLPALGVAAPALVMLGAMLLEADRARRLLRASLLEEQMKAATMEGELAAAREIQRGMLPGPELLRRLPPAVDLAACLQQARAVGGDLYDAFMLDGARLFFMVGDVTGKGVPASLFMSLSKALTKSIALRGGRGLGEVIERANAEISRENPADLFVAGVFGLLDLASGEALLCNAGHEDPLILDAGGHCRRLAMTGGPPLCVVEAYDYPVEALTLAPGDILIVATDGATEAQAADGRLFGRARLLETLAELPAPVTASQAVAAVEAAVQAFQVGTEPSDDLTVIAIRYRGPEASAISAR